MRVLELVNGSNKIMAVIQTMTAVKPPMDVECSLRLNIAIVSWTAIFNKLMTQRRDNKVFAGSVMIPVSTSFQLITTVKNQQIDIPTFFCVNLNACETG